MDDIIIRRIRPDEGLRLRTLRLRALRDAPAAFGSTAEETEARSADYWDDRAANAALGKEQVLFIAEANGAWIGLAGGFLDNRAGGPGIDLISMWVDPAYRGRDIGRRLVERVVLWARDREVEAVTLWVTETNTRALDLYLRCGFTLTGARQPLPSNPDLDEVEMVFPLSPEPSG